MGQVKRWLSRADTLFEYLGLGFLAIMILIVSWQVFSRYVLNTTPFWSEEITLILMVWVGFIGIAVGFRERLHISIEVLVRRFPESLQAWIEKSILVLILAFGLYLLVQGWQFTRLANLSTLPSTQLPSSVLYAIMPVAGLMISVYAVLNLFGVQTQKHQALTGEDERDPDLEESSAGQVD